MDFAGALAPPLAAVLPQGTQPWEHLQGLPTKDPLVAALQLAGREQRG